MPAFVRDFLVITPQVVVSVWILAGLALASAICWRRRRLVLWIGGALTAFLLPTAVAATVNAHYQYLPRLADVVNVPTWPTVSTRVALSDSATQIHPRGAVVSLAIEGRTSRFGTHRALVYLPPQYFSDPSRRFPVVYLIHGSPGAPVDWFRAARAADAGLAAARAGTPVLLVAPRASRSWSDDSECVDSPRERIQTYLVADVVAGADRQLRTLPGRAYRALAGNSAGGFCALNVGLRHRSVFSTVLDLSGFDHPTYDGGLRRLFGKADLARRVSADTPADYGRVLSARPRMHVWLDYGRSDGASRGDARRMYGLLRGSGQDVVLHSRRGGHDYGVWRPALSDALTWGASLVTPLDGGAIRGNRARP